MQPISKTIQCFLGENPIRIINNRKFPAFTDSGSKGIVTIVFSVCILEDDI